MIGLPLLSLLVTLTLLALIFRFFVYRGGQGIIFKDPFSLIIWPPSAEVEVRSLPNASVEVTWEKPNASQIEARKMPDGEVYEVAKLVDESKYVHKKENQTCRELYTVRFSDGEIHSAASRFWELPNIINLRDLGGYKSENGQRVKWGRIYRTGHLGSAGEETLNILEEYGIKLICDLRSYRERNENPDQIPPTTMYMETSIYEEDQLSAIFPKLLFNRASLSDQLGDGYIRMLEERPEQFAGVIELVAHNQPAMFHCTAGKDRAGITAALILSLLQIPRQTIIADYSLSNLVADDLYNDFMGSSASTIERFGIPADQLKPLFLAEPIWMANALDYIDNEFGGVEQYLVHHGNLDVKTISKLRDEMLA